MHACMHVCMHAYMHACMYVCMHACMYVAKYVCSEGCLFFGELCGMYVCMHAKAKGKVASEISEMVSSLDQAQVLNAAMERKAKQFDKVIGEWKGKVDRLSFDLDVSQKETRNASSELFKVKSAYEETMLQLEEVRRYFSLLGF